MIIHEKPSLKEVEKYMTAKKKKTAVKKPKPPLKDGSKYIVLSDGEQQYWSDPDADFHWDSLDDGDDSVSIMTHAQAVTVVKQLVEEEKEVSELNRSKIEVFKVTTVDLKIVYPELEATVTLGK
jgi:hypothetical protein